MINNKKILFIEDDLAHAKLMPIALKKHCKDCEIIHIKDGKSAIEWLNERKEGDLGEMPRLVLLDLNIPIMNGIEVLKKIKSDKLLKLLPVVILTTSNSNADIKTCYEENANSYLVKPIIYNEYSNLMGKIKDYWLDASMPIDIEYV